jgi:hypothetical protein
MHSGTISKASSHTLYRCSGSCRVRAHGGRLRSWNLRNSSVASLRSRRLSWLGSWACNRHIYQMLLPHTIKKKKNEKTNKQKEQMLPLRSNAWFSSFETIKFIRCSFTLNCGEYTLPIIFQKHNIKHICCQKSYI